jgi:hypothetical protein
VIPASLGATWKVLRRSQRSIISFTSNIFFPATAYFLRQAGAFLWLVVGLVLLFPLSADPMRKIPPERLALWPLDRKSRRLLRWLTPWLNPITWLLAALTLWGVGRSVSAGLWGILVGLAAIGFAAPSLSIPSAATLSRVVPRFPGPSGYLLRKDLRQLLTTLEFWMTLLLSAVATVYRVFGSEFPTQAGLMISLLIVLAFASFSTCLFGLDGETGITRYRLLPLQGWRILVSKDLALLLVIIVLTISLAPVPAFAATLVTLAIGHSRSVSEHCQQVRWRFSSGPPVGFGVIQVLALAFAGAGAYYHGAAALAIAVAVYAASVWWNGRRIYFD